MSHTIEAPVEVRLPEGDEDRREDGPWIVVVWNDPINLMSYVAFVFRRLSRRYVKHRRQSLIKNSCDLQAFIRNLNADV